MKIMGICGSPRGEKSQTLRLVKSALSGARSVGATVELVDLCGLNIKYCVGCGCCFAKGGCVLQDDFADLQRRMFEADGLILGSPNYFRGVTAQLKTMLDRMADAIHCQRLTGKYFAVVATAGGPSSDEVINYVSQVGIGLGANSVGGVGAAIGIPKQIDSALPEAEDLGRKLVNAIQKKQVWSEQEAVHAQMKARFKDLVLRNKDLWRHEFEYWQKMGWL